MLYTSQSRGDTINIAKEFAKILKPGDVVRLYGDVGAGKTVFTSGAASTLCRCDAQVCSPTFSIMNIYEAAPGGVSVYHFDLYRISDEDEIYQAGLSDYIGGDAVSFVEWPELLDITEYERVFDVTVSRRLDISDDEREIEIMQKRGK